MTGVLQRRPHARRTYDTHALGDGVVNPLSVTHDAKRSEAEQRRIRLEYSKVLTTGAPAFNPSREIGLKMPRALEALQTVQSQVEQGQLTALEAIKVLLAEKYSTRVRCCIKVALMKTARLTMPKTLATPSASSHRLSSSQVMDLVEPGVIERRQCVHLRVPPGAGKSHTAVALG